MTKVLSISTFVVLLAAAVVANLARPPAGDRNHKGETNMIDHGPQVGSFNPKNFHAYNHFGHKGEQLWRKLSARDKKKYLKKLMKYKMKERKGAGVSNKYANDDIRLQHLDRDEESVSASEKRLLMAKMEKKRMLKKQQLEDRKKGKHSKFQAKKGKKATARNVHKQHHAKEYQSP